jgi:release factor glutamine methyltransferase
MSTPDSSVAILISDLANRLQTISDTPCLDAQVLLAHGLGKPRSWLLAHPEQPVSPQQLAIFLEAASRLENGEPLPYLLGHWEFYGLDFLVNPNVLIPRPETELLVDHALSWLRAHPDKRHVVDIGTGSGCIAIALAVNIPDLRLLATDISLPALQLAKSNAQQHAVSTRIQFFQADLLDFPPQQPFDLICANLPYVPSPSLPSLPVSRQEPLLALDGGLDGMDLIHSLLKSASPHLSPDGLILLEIEASQGTSLQAFASDLFDRAQVQLIQDYAGHDRLLAIQLPNN